VAVAKAELSGSLKGAAMVRLTDDYTVVDDEPAAEPVVWFSKEWFRWIATVRHRARSQKKRHPCHPHRCRSSS